MRVVRAHGGRTGWRAVCQCDLLHRMREVGVDNDVAQQEEVEGLRTPRWRRLGARGLEPAVLLGPRMAAGSEGWSNRSANSVPVEEA